MDDLGPGQCAECAAYVRASRRCARGHPWTEAGMIQCSDFIRAYVPTPSPPEPADPPRDIEGMLSWLKAHPTQPHLVVVLCGHALFGIRGPNGVLEAYLCRIEREGLTVA